MDFWYYVSPKITPMMATTMATTLYGIKNCDSVKKARAWLQAENISYQFHDFRADGLTLTQIKTWIGDLGLETLVNKRSTTWKTLSSTEKDWLINTPAKAATIIFANPTLIKRPLLVHNKIVQVGFKDTLYQTLF